MARRWLNIASLLATILALGGCGRKVPPSVPVTASSRPASRAPAITVAATTSVFYSPVSPLPTSTWTSAPTLPPKPSPTFTPFPTPTPAPTATPLPTYPPYTDAPFTIVFVRDGNLWLSEIGRQGEQQLTTEPPDWPVHEYAISPTCDRIAYIPYRNDTRDAAIKQVDLTSRVVTSLTGLNDQASEYGIVWLDQDHILFHVQEEFLVTGERTPFPYVSSRPFYPVIFNLHTGESSVVEGYALWQSPDGQFQVTCSECAQGYAYECGCAFYLHELGTGEQWHIAPELIWGMLLGWSSDSRWVLFSNNGLYRSKDNAGLVLVDTVTRTAKAVTPADKAVLRSGWSPDRKTIAYTLCEADNARDPFENCALWAMDQDGNNAHLILEKEGRNIILNTWSPNSQILVFADCDPREDPYPSARNCDLGLVTRDGSNPSIIWTSVPFEVIRVDWLPDSSRLVLTTGPLNAMPNVWSVRADGSDLRPIAYDTYNAQLLCGH